MGDSPLKNECKKLADLRKSTLVAIVLPEESLVSTHLFLIHECINGKKCRNLDVILHSSGGDINIVYQIIELIRNHCEKMTTIIPLYAKSAASLFLLGSDNIMMGELAELGPLDTQVVEYEKGSPKFTSALNPFKTLEELRKFAVEVFDFSVKLIVKRSNLSPDEAIKHGITFASNITTPLLNKLDVETVGEYSRALMVGKEYGDRLLRRYTKWKNRDEREKILDKLIYRYPSHDYIIDYKEILDINFNAEYPNKEEEPIIKEIVKIILGLSETEIFCVNEESKTTQEQNKGAKNG